MVLITQARAASKKFLRFIIFLILSFFGQNSRASVLEDSRIATRKGDVLVQSLQTGHKILSYDLKHDCLVEEPIKILATSSCTQMYALELEFVNHDATRARGILCACPEQLFYNPIDQCWIKAQDLEPNIHLLEAKGRICRIVTREKNALVSTPVFKLELERFHVFWMGVENALSPDDVYHVLVHNDPVTAVAGLGAAGVALAAGLGTVLAVRHAMGSGPSIPEDSPYSCDSTTEFDVTNYTTSSPTITCPNGMFSIALLETYHQPSSFSENLSQRNLDTLHSSREQSHQAWQAWSRRQADMHEKTRLFSDHQGARYYLRRIGLSIQQACEYDRFLLTLPCVVDLMLESPEGRRWIIAEHKKIINDSRYRAKTEQVDGFVYKGGLLKWVWWKLFGKAKQHYTSGYHNRIAEIAHHIKEEDAEKEQEEKENEEQDNDKQEEVEKDTVSTNIEQFNNDKIEHVIEGSKMNDHKWEKLVPNKDWTEIKKIIKEVMETGKYKPYKGNGHSKVKEIKGHIVKVTYGTSSQGIYKIGSAWVE